MITAHRVGWIIWIDQIVEILGITFHKQNRLDCDTQQRVGIIIRKPLPVELPVRAFAALWRGVDFYTFSLVRR